MILELQLKFKDGFCSLHCDDLPGLNLFGPSPEKVLADFVPAWHKMHEVAPHQVMPVPPIRNSVYPPKAKIKKGRK